LNAVPRGEELEREATAVRNLPLLRRGRARASNKSRRSVLSRGLARSYPETREGRGQRPVLGGGDGQGSEGGPRGYCVEMPARSIRDLTPHVERATCERSKTGKLLASPTKNGKTGIETHLVCLDPACSVDHLADERSPAYFLAPVDYMICSFTNHYGSSTCSVPCMTAIYWRPIVSSFAHFVWCADGLGPRARAAASPPIVASHSRQA
jgi:hypothetical protein